MLRSGSARSPRAGSSTITFTWSSSDLRPRHRVRGPGVHRRVGGEHGVGPGQVRDHNGASSTRCLCRASHRPARVSSTSLTARSPTPRRPAPPRVHLRPDRGGSNVVAFDSTVSATVAPTAKQSPAGASSGGGGAPGRLGRHSAAGSDGHRHQPDLGHHGRGHHGDHHRDRLHRGHRASSSAPRPPPSPSPTAPRSPPPLRRAPGPWT